MFKFRPVDELFLDAKKTFLRFPYSLICSWVGTLSIIVFFDFSYSEQKDYFELIHLSMIISLGISVFLSIKVFAESHRWSQSNELAANLVAWGFLIVYYFILPDKLRYFDLNRFWLINANLHLFVAIAPYLFVPNSTAAFWQYNKALFLRFAIAFIYSNTIYVGVAIALGVTDHLFDFIKFDAQIYAQLWFAVVGIFNTWFFLKGVPGNCLAPDDEGGYPKGLRIFTQFILIPLVLLYLVILYMYMGKIIANWSLPRGWLSSFILGVSILGVMTLLLVHPLKNDKKYSWIRIYSKYFYLALFPLIVMMAIAVWVRIADYGITEQRYFVLVFTLWLFVIALRFSFKPQSDIRLIPMTLFVLVAVATWGPWSAMSVSKWNQTARLEKKLTDNGLLKDGKLIRAQEKMHHKEGREISNIVAYLQSSFGLSHLEKWAASEVSVDWDKLSAKNFVKNELGLEYSGYYSRGIFRGYQPETTRFYFSTAQNEVIDVSGYDYYGNFYLHSLDNMGLDRRSILKTDRGDLEIHFDADSREIKAVYQDKPLTIMVMTDKHLQGLTTQYGLTGYNLDQKMMTYQAENTEFRVRAVTTSVNGALPATDKDQYQLTHIGGYVLFSIK